MSDTSEEVRKPALASFPSHTENTWEAIPQHNEIINTSILRALWWFLPAVIWRQWPPGAGSKTASVYPRELDRRPWQGRLSALIVFCGITTAHHSKVCIPSEKIFHRRKWKQSCLTSRSSRLERVMEVAICMFPRNTSWVSRKDEGGDKNGD
jgi:hypothetical protein